MQSTPAAGGAGGRGAELSECLSCPATSIYQIHQGCAARMSHRRRRAGGLGSGRTRGPPLPHRQLQRHRRPPLLLQLCRRHGRGCEAGGGGREHNGHRVCDPAAGVVQLRRRGQRRQWKGEVRRGDKVPERELGVPGWGRDLSRKCSACRYACKAHVAHRLGQALTQGKRKEE